MTMDSESSSGWQKKKNVLAKAFRIDFTSQDCGTKQRPPVSSDLVERMQVLLDEVVACRWF